MTNNGWIKLHRKITEWEWWNDHDTFRVFLTILLTVNHQEKKWLGIRVETGQKITSYSNLAQQSGLSVQTIRTSLNKLKSTGELTIRNTNKYSIITILKWKDYQEITGKSTGHQQANQQAANNKQEIQEEKNDKKDTYPPDFEEFYLSYPLKVGKATAYTSWFKIKKEEQEQLITAIKKQIELHHFRGNDGKDYTPHPTTWLNQRRWEDEVHDKKLKPTSISL